jgi:predicted RNA-binding Zn-ribbon protein involved in translation (DUF1610 family)
VERRGIFLIVRWSRGFWGLLNMPLVAGVIAGVLGPVLAAAILSGMSAVWGGGPLRWVGVLVGWVSTVHLLVWAFLAGVLVTVVTVGLLTARRRRTQKIRATAASLALRPPEYQLMYAGVLWVVSAYTPDTAEVRVPPRCPQCGTELIEMVPYGRRAGWISRCVLPDCGFASANVGSWDDLKPFVVRIARRKLELGELTRFDPCQLPRAG